MDNMTVIDRYTRQEAIDDGMLIDVSNMKETKKAGFKIPVCLTVGVHRYVTVPADMEGKRDYSHRLWDTLYMAVKAIRAMKAKNAAEADMRLIPFEVVYTMAGNKDTKPTLWLAFNECEGFTIMTPEEY